MAQPSRNREIRHQVPAAPVGRKRLQWLSPGLLWAVSAVGAGEILMTPRIAAIYGYALLWAVIVIGVMNWLILREVGRFTVVSGRTILHGYSELPGPANWAVWIIFVPQVVSAIATISGESLLAGRVVQLVIPISAPLLTALLILIAGAVVVGGRLSTVNRISAWISIGLLVAAFVTVAKIFPSVGKLLGGLVPQIPAHFDAYTILAWLGFLMAQAAGYLWYAYWVAGRGYAGGPATSEQPTPQENDRRVRRLRDWKHMMSTTAVVASVVAVLIVIGFYILGAQLLAPSHLVPSETNMGRAVTRLLAGVWGTPGRWLFIVTATVAIWSTVMDHQDGWGRLLADATRMLVPNKETLERRMALEGASGEPRRTEERTWDFLWSGNHLNRGYVVVMAIIAPILVVFIWPQPLLILSIGGIIAAVHTPVVVYLTAWANRRLLPRHVEPNWITSTGMIITGLFFTLVAVLYFAQLFGVPTPKL